MALIKSISGIRGTIGGKPGQGLTPVDIVKFSAAYGAWLLQSNSSVKVVIGRDGRMSGPLVHGLVVNTLLALGIDVIDLGITTTPTVEIAVPLEKATGGIILTASHNPREWNALKLLNSKGEFISGADGADLLAIAEAEAFEFKPVTALGSLKYDDTYLQKHIDAILQYPLVDKDAIARKNFRVVVDGINSSGAVYVPALLNALGVHQVEVLNSEVTGDFAHNPEPLPEHLQDIIERVKAEKADLGIVVDPDVDRLCFVNEDGSLFGEEYTLVAIADYFLKNGKGATVSNMSSTKSLRELTEKAGGTYFSSAVGEVNVVQKMKAENAIIGGEGNGGVIVPDFHYGRDALIGIALFLTHLAKSEKSMTALRALYPNYVISKNKLDLPFGTDTKSLFAKVQLAFKDYPMNTEDGLKIEIGADWVQLRTSNTEPIMRVYSESDTPQKADALARQVIDKVRSFL